MRKVFSVGTALLAVVGLLAVAPSANADVTVKAEPGVAFPLTKPQSQRFDVGGSGAVKLEVGLTPWLDVGPSVSVLAFPSAVPGVDTPTAWGFGGTVRVKRPHDRSNEGTGFSAVSPWADADLQYVRTGSLDRPGMTAAVGASVPTSDARNIWVGPFVRYQGVFTSDKPGFDTHSAKVLIVGLSVELGPTVKRETVLDSDNDGTPDVDDQCPYVPGPKDNHGCPLPTPPVAVPPVQPPVTPTPPPVVPEVKFEFTQRVQFAWDSDVILPESVPGLKEVVQALLKDKDLQIRVEGHASSEGQVEHNNKLSLKRAQSVVQFLVVNGVDAKHLQALGFGSRVPVADNATEAGRVANRRVEFNVSFTLVKGSASK
jgi:outer membrane protein OmpA-like peptidoglycan-associated protein